MLYDWKSTTKKSAKNTGTCRLNNQWISEDIREEIKKYLEANENKDTTLSNLWEAEKAVIRGKFMAIQANLRKQEKAQINNLKLEFPLWHSG